MNGSDVRKAALSRRIRLKAVALFGLSSILGLSFAASFPAPAAQAQFPFPWRFPYFDGYPPPVPPGRVAAGEEPEGYGPDGAYGILPVAEIRRRVALHGFHLIAAPRHKDRIYLAEAEDVHGLRHRLVFDAYEGKILENTKLTTIPKKTALKPTLGPETATNAASVDKKDVTPPDSKPSGDADKK
jgi:hypothetical protein